MLKILVRLIIVIMLIIAGLYGLFGVSKLRNFQLFGKLVDRVETTEKVVALTFDDAPTAYSDEVLEILDQHAVPATFYLMGQNIEQYPEQAKHILDRGDEVGNHTYSHKRMMVKTYGFIKTEVQKTNELIRGLGYSGEITFRPPYGKKLILLPWHLKQHETTTVMWDVEPDTFFQGDKDGIVRYTLENTRPGSIILMHPFCETVCQSDREALPEIITKLKEEGYRFVKVSELLAINP